MKKITYIKNNQEKELNKFPKSKYKENDLFIIDNFLKLKRTSTFTHIIKKDINFIHIKNEKLNNVNKIECENKDTIIILENCTFNSQQLEFNNGNFQIINPKFKNPKTKIIIENCDDIEIIGNEEINLHNLRITKTDKINLTSINQINRLHIDFGKIICLNNLKEIKELYMFGHNIEIKKCYIKVSNLYNNNRIFSDKLIINNSNLNFNDNWLYANKIELNNSNLIFEEEKSNKDNRYYSHNITFHYLINLLKLNNSHIISQNNKIEFSKESNVIIDELSSIIAPQIIINKYKYETKENPNELFTINNNSQYMKEFLINTLKEISKIYHNVIEEEHKKSELKLLKQLEENYNKEQDNIKKNTKKLIKQKITNIKINDIKK